MFCFHFLHFYRIDTNFLIKITDFGLAEDVFESDYYRQGSNEEVIKLPVKWMAPESLSDEHFSEKSDVVCFYNPILSLSLLTKQDLILYNAALSTLTESTVHHIHTVFLDILMSLSLFYSGYLE